MPEPTKEHAFLQQFAGEWETEAEMTMAPGQPPEKCRGHESSRLLGGFWVVGEMEGQMPGGMGTMQGLILLGYDTDKQKYVGTWVDSTNGHQWEYEGTVDPSGRILTLETEGPCLWKGPGAIARFKEVVEFKSRDHRVFTSSIQNDDGTWTQMVTVNYRRKSS